MILTTILLILKIIGITLLVLIALVLLLVMLILFVPVRYKACGVKERNAGSPIRAEASVSWFFKIISAVYEYNENGRGLIIRIFGIRLRSREEKEERRRQKARKREAKKKDKKAGEKKSKTKVEYTMVEYDDTSDVFNEHAIDPKGFSATDESYKPPETPDSGYLLSEGFDRTQDPVGDLEIKPGLYEKLIGILVRIKDKITGIYYKISRIFKNISSKAEEADYYINVLSNDASNRQAVSLIIKKAKSLIRSIRPKKIKGHIDFGAEDPADTGLVLAAAAMAYPLYSPGLKVNPDFENRGVAFDALLKGRIYVFVLVKTFIALYFNKKVKRLIKIMKKENNSNGR